MPYMNGFELCKKILELDVNVRVCFVSAAKIEYLVKRLLAELD